MKLYKIWFHFSCVVCDKCFVMKRIKYDHVSPVVLVVGRGGLRIFEKILFTLFEIIHKWIGFGILLVLFEIMNYHSILLYNCINLHKIG